MTAAMIDRLTHQAYLVNMNGNSYRMKQTKEWLEKQQLVSATSWERKKLVASFTVIILLISLFFVYPILVYNFSDWCRVYGTAYEDGIEDQTKIDRLIKEVFTLKKEIETLKAEKAVLEDSLGILPF